MPRPSPNHGKLRLPNYDDRFLVVSPFISVLFFMVQLFLCCRQGLSEMTSDHSQASDRWTLPRTILVGERSEHQAQNTAASYTLAQLRA